jgi:hypothetical protein
MNSAIVRTISLLLFLPCVGAAQDYATQAKSMFAKAAKVLFLSPQEENISASGTMELENLEHGNVTGAWSLYWTPDGRSQLEIVLPGFKKNSWTNNEIEWSPEDPPQSPAYIEEIGVALRLADLLLANYPEATYKLKKEKINRVDQPCSELRQTKSSFVELCVDRDSSMPLQVRTGAWSALYELADYKKTGDSMFPHTIRAFQKNREIFRIDVAKVEGSAQVDESLVKPPSDLQPLAGMRCAYGDTKDRLIRTVQPRYSDAAKRGQVSGPVVSRLHFDQEGKLVESHIVSGNPMLVAIVQDAIPHWRFLPYICNGIPTETALTITIGFSLGGAPSN